MKCLEHFLTEWWYRYSERLGLYMQEGWCIYIDMCPCIATNACKNMRTNESGVVNGNSITFIFEHIVLDPDWLFF